MLTLANFGQYADFFTLLLETFQRKLKRLAFPYFYTGQTTHPSQLFNNNGYKVNVTISAPFPINGKK